ncbi:MAG: hypothetical protein M1840_001702 [Geoglossum simile]|nr:MAG: hypothetical protein M1840_001702 [Geoglossum simile]
MAPSPTTPPQKSPGHNNDTTPIRATSFLAAALLGRPINIQRRSSNDLEDRAAVSAELRREGAKAKRQTLDLGKPLGPYDTNSVRDRVRKWQAQGGGVITQPDLVYPPEATPVVSEVGAKTGGGSNDEETDIEALRKRNRRERRKERIAAEKGQEDPEAGLVTPKKRVVSDGHWRKRPSPPRRVVSGKGKQPDRSPVALPDDGIRVRPMREVSERRRVTADEKGISKALLGDDGIRVYVTKRQGDDARKTPRVVVGEEDGIRVYSIKKGGNEKRKASKTSIDGDGEGSRPVKQENDGGKASKAPIGGDDNRVRDIRGREEARREESRRPLDDDGIRVYSTKRRVSAHTKPNKSTEDTKRSPRSKSDSQTEEDRPSPRNTPTASRNRRKSSEHVDVAPERSPKENRASPVEEKSRRRRSNRQKSRTPEHSPRPRESPTAGEHPKPKPKTQATKINVLKEIYDESKRALRSAKAADPSPPVPGKRIEAWLSKTPDPLVEPPQNPDTIPPSEIGQPDMMSVIKEDDESDVHISASQSGRRRRDSPAVGNRGLPLEDAGPKSPAREVPDVVESTPQLVSPNLKRVGAKRESPSPTREKRKSSPVKKLPVQDENATSPTAGPRVEPSSPVIDIESSEFAELPSTLKKRLSTIASVETLNVRSATPPAESTPPVSEATFSGGEVPGRTKEEEPHGSEAGDTFNPEMPEIPGKKSNLKRRLTTHADLISVLSLPRGGSKSIRSARSIRTNRSRLATATIGDLLGELAADETKYMRELRTLVDGVIPVLLHCALSKSDSAVVAELFQRAAESHKHDPTFTRPIIEMGIALERLKVLHKKIPVQDADEMLRWANGAREVYAEYLKAWRLGFQDVVVNLAPGNEGLAPDEQSVFKGLPRDENGDVVNGDGERVDVAFLLKRPLVRLKYLAKTFKGINFIMPSPSAGEQATRYQNLVIDARRRANEERARLEDEAAASIDATRARDPRTLGPLTGVSIDQTRRVRARDIFSMDLHHSSGQRMDCKVEMILRDDAPTRGDSGDLLICEVDGTGRWLLFPPVAFGRVSARNGSLKGEIVVMIRGYHGRGKEWQELLTLHNVDEQVGFEWVQLLGLKPVPPEITRRPSFVVKDLPSHRPSPSLVSSGGTQSHVKSRTPSPRGIEVPIGELARFTTRGLDISEAESPIRERSESNVEREDLDSAVSTAEADEMGRQHGIPVHPPSQGERSASPASSHRATVEARTRYDHSPHSPHSLLVREDPIISPISREPSQSLRDISISPPSRKTSRQQEHVSEPQYRPPRDLNEAMMMAGGRPPPSALKRSKAKRRSHYDDSPTKHKPLRTSRHLDDEPQTPPPDDRRPSKVIDRADSPSPTARHLTKKAEGHTPSPVRETPIATSKIRVSRGEEITVSFPTRPASQAERPESRDSRASYDEKETISQSEEPSTPKREVSPEPEEKPLEELSVMKRRRPSALPALDLPTINKTRKADPITPIRSPSRLSSEDAVLGSPLSDVSGDTSIISRESHEFRSPTGSEVGDIAPPPPPHSPNPIQLKGGKTPVLAHPSSAQQAGGRRRSSSPLKHEYEPSSASSSATSESEESEEYAAEGHDASSFSESSEEEELEDGDAPTPLLPMAALRALGKITSPHGSIYSLPNGNFSPTQATPQASAQKAAKTFKAIANIFSWSEKGAWEPLHLDECSIAVSPGLIEAFQMREEHSRSASPSEAEPTGDSPRQPLVALELTPLVPLRRGTALDISIRSPPMAESKIKIGNNIMFRSRSPEDCEALYGAINTSRINNPKYIALQNAIPHNDGLSSFMDRRASGRGAGSSWSWGLNRGSYRATSAAAPSIASSESSIGSFTSAFSALKRFGNGGRLFNISKSTISSRNGSRTGSITTSSSGASSSFGGNSPGTTTPPALQSDDTDPNKGSPIGLSNTKIRLYSRETASKWRDMGSARLTIMRPPPGPREPNPQNPHHHQQAEEKRILVTSKTAGAKPLLDVCLSESCFERVARTGIALSVWEEVVSKDGVVGGVPAEGGVGGKSRVYMIQMKTEAETAYTFSLVGKLRY